MMTIAFVAVSCRETNLYDPEIANQGKQIVEKEFNTFNYSTIQNVSLSVDYSAFETYGPVFFSVYNENPFVGEGDDEHLDKTIQPIFEDYTNDKGKFCKAIILPAFASHLYVVTGNLFVFDSVIETDIQNGRADAVAVNRSTARTRAASILDIADEGEDVQEPMANLSYIVTQQGVATDEQIYGKWLTPLGSWNSRSGRPNYFVKPGEVDPNLLCTSEEIRGLYSALSEALDANKGCNPEYRNSADLTLEKESEVTITMLGGSTCWNSSLGYYYYMGDSKPTNLQDLKIIMLLPNTQDGNWKKMTSKMDYNGNIGVTPGDAIRLVYYPHINNGGDLSEATTMFPKGIKIGFILKTNGWGMQGSDYCIKGVTEGNRAYNVWEASTDGLSYCRPFGTPGQAPYQYANPNGESRSAKFAYNAPNGDRYAIISFEDACNDQDFDDVIFALKPVSSFTPLNDIEDKITTTRGVYLFEDLWPSVGDYDLNDVVVDFKHEKKMSKKKDVETNFKMYQETFYLTTYQNYVTLKSGLALKLNTPVTPSNIVMKKIVHGTTEVVDANYAVRTDGVVVLTNDVKAELGTTYILELNYSVGQENSEIASIQPFVFRKDGADKTWEVHIPFEAPSASMNFDYFGKDDDASYPEQGRYFVRAGDYPFAAFLFGADINIFKGTILKRENESKKIDEIYPNFLKWSASKGKQFADWYLHPAQ